MNVITRPEALAMLADANFSDSLTRHSLAAEAVMRALAARLGQDQDIWAMTGLLHDLDYPQTESTPERHGVIAAEKLANKLPEDAIAAIIAHNGEMNGHAPASVFDYALRCGETVTGLISAAALMRPTGYEGMAVKSVKKKMKDKAFAANVNRANILQCEQAGLSLDEFLALAIAAMSEMENRTI